MDGGLGHLQELSAQKYEELLQKKVDGVFKVGETYECNGSKLKLTGFLSGNTVLQFQLLKT